MAVAPLGSTPVATYEGSAGAGRIVQALSEAGLRVDSLTQIAIDQDVAPDHLASVDLGRQFDTVVLGSHLVNGPDESRRVALLDLGLRHLAAGGSLVVEHHPVDWVETAAEVRPTPGGAVGMIEVRREGPFVSAVSVYDVGGRIVRQPFIALVLSERDLADVLDRAGLRVSRRLSPTLIEARPRA